ncbi:MAG: hypothetical protein Ct9H300mP8_03710 [Gammaproteobacteria bacterium]|nr:MAG: hypothetical protein Ct9H300mP8_03710 [Gammaproteobacteria bacterium]
MISYVQRVRHAGLLLGTIARIAVARRDVLCAESEDGPFLFLSPAPQGERAPIGPPIGCGLLMALRKTNSVTPMLHTRRLQKHRICPYDLFDAEADGHRSRVDSFDPDSLRPF